MTTLTLPGSTRESHGLRGLFGFIGDLFAGIRDGHEMATRYERLRVMSDAELATHGLTRDQIPTAAVNGVKGL